MKGFLFFIILTILAFSQNYSLEPDYSKLSFFKEDNLNAIYLEASHIQDPLKSKKAKNTEAKIIEDEENFMKKEMETKKRLEAHYFQYQTMPKDKKGKLIETDYHDNMLSFDIDYVTAIYFSEDYYNHNKDDDEGLFDEDFKKEDIFKLIFHFPSGDEEIIYHSDKKPDRYSSREGIRKKDNLVIFARRSYNRINGKLNDYDGRTERDYYDKSGSLRTLKNDGSIRIYHEDGSLAFLVNNGNLKDKHLKGFFYRNDGSLRAVVRLNMGERANIIFTVFDADTKKPSRLFVTYPRNDEPYDKKEESLLNFSVFRYFMEELDEWSAQNKESVGYNFLEDTAEKKLLNNDLAPIYPFDSDNPWTNPREKLFNGPSVLFDARGKVKSMTYFSDGKKVWGKP